MQAVCVPLVGMYEPAEHAGQLGVLVAVQVPVRNVPAGHDVVHARHAVWLPALGAYVPAPQAAQLGVAVAVHEPERN